MSKLGWLYAGILGAVSFVACSGNDTSGEGAEGAATGSLGAALGEDGGVDGGGDAGETSSDE